MMGFAEDMRRAAAETDRRALGLLGLLVPGFEAAGWDVPGQPHFLDETSSGHFVWTFRADREGLASLDVTVELVPADGDAPEGGAGFNLMVATEPGRPLLDWAGYNYGRNLWVPAADPEAVASRWRSFSLAVLDTERWLPEVLAFAARDDAGDAVVG